MDLTLDQLKPYFGGWLEIKKVGEYILQAGIKNLSIADEVLKIEFVWKIKFEGWPNKDPKWVHIHKFKDYSIDLEHCHIPDLATVKEKTIFLYFAPADEEITLHMAKDSSPVEVLDVEGCPAELKLELQKMKEQFFSALDLSTIPRVNFGIEEIPIGETRNFMRIDLKWQDVVWSFVRIQNDPKNNHARIYHGLLHEIAEQFMLTRYDIEDLVLNKGGGYMGRSVKNNLNVWGTSTHFRGEPDHELTRSILKKEFTCEVF